MSLSSRASRRPGRFTITTHCAALLALFVAAPLAAADRVPVAKRIPRDSLIYFAVPNAPTVVERVSASFLGKMARDNEFQPFLKAVETWAAEYVSKEIEQQAGLSLADLRQLPQGEMAFALLPMDEDKLPVVFFFQFGEHRQQIDTLIQKGIDRAKEKGAKLSSEEIEGTEVSLLELPLSDMDDKADASDDEDTAEKNPFDEGFTSWFIKDDYVVFGAGKNWPKSVLSRWDGEGTRNLADHRAFQTIMTACRDEDREPCVEFYVDIIGLMKSVLQSGEAVSPQVAIFLGFLPQLGLDKLRGVGGVYDLGWDGTEQRSRMLVQIDQPPTRLMKLFQFPPRDLQPSDWIPSSAGAYGAISWDLAAAWQAIADTVDTFQGRGKFDDLVARTSKEMELGDFNLKTDLVDQFTGTIEYFTPLATDQIKATLDATEEKADDTESAETAGPKFGVGLELAQPDTFRKTLANLSKSPLMATIEQRDFEGQTIYETPGEPTFYFAVVANRLLITPDRELIENALRDNKGEGLRDTPEFQSYLKKLTGPFSALGFEREADNVAGVVEFLKKTYETGGKDDLKGWIDLSTLPDGKAIRKYLTPNASTMKPHEHGLILEQFSLPATEQE